MVSAIKHPKPKPKTIGNVPKQPKAPPKKEVITIFKKYSVQLILFATICCNTIHAVWKDQGDYIKTWLGYDGYGEYFHYWYLFNFRGQFFLYLFMSFFLLLKLRSVYIKYGLLELRYIQYAISVLRLYIILSLLEVLYYMFYGPHQSEEIVTINFITMLAAFLIGNIHYFITNKAWK